jgi:hypothetical protein
MLMRALLDGHPDISAFPVHDGLADGLCDGDPAVGWLEARDTAYLRRLLSRSLYYDLERAALRGRILFEMGAGRIYVRPFEFDFASFDRLWMLAVATAPEWSIPAVFATIHGAYGGADRGEIATASRFLLSVGLGHPDTPARVIDTYADCRLVYMARNLEDVVAARAARGELEGDAESRNSLQTTVESMIASGKIRRIAERQAVARRLAEQRPDRVLVVDFDGLLAKAEESMRRVAAFMGLAWQDSLTRATLLGTDIVAPDGCRYDGPPLDHTSALPPRERALLRRAVRAVEDSVGATP